MYTPPEVLLANATPEQIKEAQEYVKRPDVQRDLAEKKSREKHAAFMIRLRALATIPDPKAGTSASHTKGNSSGHAASGHTSSEHTSSGQGHGSSGGGFNPGSVNPTTARRAGRLPHQPLRSSRHRTSRTAHRDEDAPVPSSSSSAAKKKGSKK